MQTDILLFYHPLTITLDIYENLQCKYVYLISPLCSRPTSNKDVVRKLRFT